ncbi:MAG: hypothetical protein ACRDRS_13640 [Pseudonocardiaceae bacterium]
MPDMTIAVAQEALRYAAHRSAAVAAAKAKRLWPNVIGEVLADEIMALLDLPSWLGSQTRTQRLITTILSIPEGTADSRDDDRPRVAAHAGATPDPGASRAA